MKPRDESPSWRDDKRKTAERGYGGKWQKAREQFLHKNPLCDFCKKEGRIELATVVDHITPHRGDKKLFWSRSNWQPLCATHHNRDKKLIENGRAVHQIGIDGWPL